MNSGYFTKYFVSTTRMPHETFHRSATVTLYHLAVQYDKIATLSSFDHTPRLCLPPLICLCKQ